MAVEGHLLRIRRSLEEKLGVEEAAYVIEGQPPGGWGSLVTKEHLDLRLGALEERIEGLEERFDLRLGALEEGSGLRQSALEERFEGLEERTTLRLEAVEHRLSAKLADLSSSVDRRLRTQTWIMTGTLVTGLGVALAVGQAL